MTYVRGQGGWQIPFAAENWRGVKPLFDIVDAKSGEVVFAAGQKITPARRQQGGQGRPRPTC